MARAILRSTDPLLPVLLATRVCPSARSPRLPTRPGCEQQRRERCAGEEQVPPVVFAHLSSPSSLFRSREDAPFAPTAPSGDRPLFTSAVSSVVMDHLPRPKGPRREAPPGFAGGRLTPLVRPLSRVSSPRRPPSLPRPSSRAHTGSCASFLSFRARRLVRLPPGTGCEQQRGQRGTRQEQVSPVDLGSHPITSFQLPLQHRRPTRVPTSGVGRVSDCPATRVSVGPSDGFSRDPRRG
jgi:hypothetical protein